ncbi:MAG: hypothetical protein M1377_08545 [Deltaproteobacteria bacterium]|nr:hypothetical protein [Deltaproteobacteria bacterium]
MQLKDVSVKPASDYKACQVHSGLNIAVDPFLEEERVLDVFGDNLVSRGYLPVLVVIENRTTDRAFLVAKGDIQLLMDPGPAKSDTFPTQGTREIKDPALDVAREDSERQGNALLFQSGSLALAGPIALPAIVFAAPLMAKAQEDAFIITRNLEKRELVDRTVYPGESHNGFIYFLLKKDSVPADVRGVRVKLKDMKTGEPLVFSISVPKGE